MPPHPIWGRRLCRRSFLVVAYFSAEITARGDPSVSASWNRLVLGINGCFRINQCGSTLPCILISLQSLHHDISLRRLQPAALGSPPHPILPVMTTGTEAKGRLVTCGYTRLARPTGPAIAVPAVTDHASRCPAVGRDRRAARARRDCRDSCDQSSPEARTDGEPRMTARTWQLRDGKG